jgi:hypothetical protein
MASRHLKDLRLEVLSTAPAVPASRGLSGDGDL